MKNFKVPKVQVTTVQYTDQIRPLVVLATALCSAKMTPVQLDMVNKLLANMDEQAKVSEVLDVLPALTAMVGPLLAAEVGQHITLTSQQMAAIGMGMVLLEQQYGQDSTVKTFLPLVKDALKAAKTASLLTVVDTPGVASIKFNNGRHNGWHCPLPGWMCPR